MNKARHVRNYDLHSWVGIALGFFVFIVAFTGALALFNEELRVWEDPARRLTMATDGPAIHPTFLGFTEEVAEKGELTRLSLKFPDIVEPYYEARSIYRDADDQIEREYRRWSTEDLSLLAERGEGLSVWLLDFHRDLMWPDALGGRTIGRSLVGVVGVILMLAILSGVIAHTKIFEELFSLRYWRSVRLKWQDTHKVAGLWGLPFYAMMSTTGAFLGIVAILSPIVAVLAFKGDTEALIDAVVGAPPEPAGIEAVMLPMDEVYAMTHPESGEHPARVIISNWNDEAAVYDVLYDANTELATYDTISINGATGERVPSTVFDRLSAANRVTNAVTPLHYATYGGAHGSFSAIALKAVYFLLGLSLAIMTALGNMMWIERRLNGREGNKSETFYRRLSRLTVGVTTGLPLASVAIFYLDKLYIGAESARLFWTGTTYFSVWLAVIVFALTQANDYRTTRRAIALTGLGLIGLPFLNALMTGDAFWTGLAGGHTNTAWIDITLLIVGTCTLAASQMLPTARPERDRKAASTGVPDRAVPAE